MESCKYCHRDDPDKPLWVQCSLCPQWVHVSCVPLKHLQDQDGNEIKEYPQSSKEINYFQCDGHNGDSKLMKKLNKRSSRKRSPSAELPSPPRKRYGLRKKQQIDYIALNEGDDKKLKKVHPHAEAFLKCFTKWENNSNLIDSTKLNEKFFQLREPLKILDPENTGMNLPKPQELGLTSQQRSLTVADITQILGGETPVDVMDVQSQQNEKWSLSQWNQYFSETPMDQRDRIRNVISLEVSHFDDKFHIDRPKAVEENDLVNIVWKHMGNEDPKPKVTRYVLMSSGNSYTDFHLDFAGTSVYYNLVSGHKKFILFPPTDHNLKVYTDWCQDLNQNLIFLGDLLDEGIAMELHAGDLFMLPSGWIHAVYTPIDSLIVGGNFLTVRDIETQLQVVKVERLTKVPKRFTFPMFDLVMGQTCEWALSPGVQNNHYKMTKGALIALQNYMKLQDTKYKPFNYPSKRSMIKKLEELIGLKD